MAGQEFSLPLGPKPIVLALNTIFLISFIEQCFSVVMWTLQNIIF